MVRWVEVEDERVDRVPQEGQAAKRMLPAFSDSSTLVEHQTGVQRTGCCFHPHSSSRGRRPIEHRRLKDAMEDPVGVATFAALSEAVAAEGRLRQRVDLGLDRREAVV